MDLAVFVGARSPMLRAVSDVLRDWAAVGLVSSFVWVDESDIEPGRSLADIVATVVTGAAATRVRLQDHLADNIELRLVRLTAISALGGQGAQVAEEVASQLYMGLNGIGTVSISPLHCLLARHGAGGWSPAATWRGWHTAVLAPEDAWTPAATATDLTYTHSDAEYHNHAAAGLASAVGLWTGVAVAPFDGVPAAAVDRPIVARSFVRRLDASAVTAELRHALTDLTHGLPRPRFGEAMCERLRAPASGAAHMAGAVRNHHAALFARRRQDIAVQPRIRLGALAAIRMFLRFLGAAIQRAPGVLFEQARTATAAAISRGLQQAIFGDGDSRFEVITLGITASGLPADAAALAHSADDMAQRVRSVVPAGEPVIPELSPFWRDVVHGALTLADGGERAAHLPPIVVDGMPGVMPTAGAIAPDPDGPFTVPPQLAARIGVEHVAPHDIRAQDHAATALRAAGTDAETARTTNRFDAWRTEMSRTYTGHLGRALADELHGRWVAVTELLAEIGAVRNENADRRVVEEDQRGTRRVLLVGLLVLLLIAAAIGLVRGLRLFSVELAYTGAAISLALWLVTEAVLLYRQQRRIFQLLAARDRADEALALATTNLGYAITELQVGAILYEQYLAWASVLGRFLHQPFGPVDRPVPPPRLAGPLPRAVGLGIALPDPDRIAEVAHDLRGTLFRCGWLDTLWSSLLADAPRRLGHAGLPLRRDPHQLLGDHAIAPDSLLRAWSATVAAAGVTAAAGDALWSQARSTLLAGGVPALCRALFGDVEVIGQANHGAAGRLPANTFLTELQRAVDNPLSGHFSIALFTSTALSEGAHAVASTIVIGAAALRPGVRVLAPADGDGTGLDQFLVVVQTSAPIPATQLQLSAPARASDAAQGEPASADVEFQALDI